MSANARRDFAQLLAGARMALQNPDRRSEETRLRLVDQLAKAEGLIETHMVPWEIAVHVARIDHRHGSEFFAALTRQALMAQFGSYCRIWWSEIDDKRDPADLDDDAVASTYFDRHHGECLETDMISIPAPEALVTMPVRSDRYVTLSNHHIQPSTGDLLDEWARLPPEDRPLGVAETGYGWFVLTDPIHQDSVEEVPVELTAVLSFARDQGCRYLLLDRDGDEVNGLNHFDW
ncbi:MULTISPECIES: DUF5983 family protein [Sphingomonadaceae]|uniref:DUF5983 family protein n=1 Tax=Sphingomonadales TaxID=204457 RepID=UPI0007700C9C|nr:hypothetical protein [Sphingobium sp. TKS]AMK23239.1 hypothetical protein K426_11515 [Sphingobium sp. TKS]MCF8709085.1 hypothetical protein [Rhizorhapis sp. SPR117]